MITVDQAFQDVSERYLAAAGEAPQLSDEQFSALAAGTGVDMNELAACVYVYADNIESMSTPDVILRSGMVAAFLAGVRWREASS